MAAGMTAIVVGAGASKEFGLPVGSELQDNIATLTNTVMRTRSRTFPIAGSAATKFHGLFPQVVGLHSVTSGEEQRLAQKAQRISDGVVHAASIDNFLHAHQLDKEIVAIGKLAIAKCILAAEESSSLSYSGSGIGFYEHPDNQHLIRPSNTWLGLLVKYLSAGKNFEQFCSALNSITFICFNYDRCIERYLFGAVPLLYPDSEYNEAELNDVINLIRPYGSLGTLISSDAYSATFGKVSDDRLLLEAAANIRTFTEGMETDVQEKVRETFRLSDTAVFLGYGFIPVNDSFLFGHEPYDIPKVFGTVLGISEERSDYIADVLKGKCMMYSTLYDGLQHRGQLELRAEGCAALLSRFSHIFNNIGIE